jgi:hypothetical protein
MGSADGTGTQASFNRPYGVAVDSSSNVFVAERFAHRIRKVTPNGGTHELYDVAVVMPRFSLQIGHTSCTRTSIQNSSQIFT